MFRQGDAFDAKSLRGFQPQVVVSSGFYDWINDAQQIRRSIRSVFEALTSGGTFILTIQTNHPNLSFVQKVFCDFNHKPLQMTMRSQQQMSRWLQKSGFEIEKILQDPRKYYAVFKVRKP